MDDRLKQLLDALRNPDAPLDAATVDALLEEYPFFTLPAVLALKGRCGAIDESRRRDLMAAVALNASDPAGLMQLIDRDSEVWSQFYPPEKPAEVTTVDAIATFLDNYGHSTPEEDRLLERLIFNPTPDYSTMLAREEENSEPNPDDAAEGSQDALINSFILKSRHEGHFPSSLPHDDEEPEAREKPKAAPPPDEHPVEPREPVNDTSLSESLAKIYIKQRRYDKAYEIISSLSLNNPKKSVYFADQLRFLQKLMLNSSYAKE